MDILPLELVTRIIDIVSYPDPDDERSHKARLASLALVSKQWRVIVESQTFCAIRVESTELETFDQVYGGLLGTQRRSCLSDIVLAWTPPGQCRKKWRARSRHERAAENQRNNESFTAAIRDLFTILASWPYDAKRDRAIALSIYQKGPLPESVKLLAPETIPEVKRIASFRCDEQEIRIGSLPLVASRLPNLQTCHWEYFNSNEPLNSIRTRRDQFARHLSLLTDSSIRQAHFTIRTYTPDNEDPETSSLLLPGHTTDHLSKSLHSFSQSENLSVLDIHEVIISPALFWPAGNGASTPYWPNLTILRVTVNPMAADGGWYFEQNPHVTPDNDDDRSSQHGAIYNTTHRFRAWPSPKMETLLHSMAKAVTRMPALKFFAAGSQMPWPHSIDFEFFYLTPGEKQDLGEPEEGTIFDSNDITKPRLFWRVPRFWRMNESVEKLWKDTLGSEGIIEYQEWVLGKSYRSEVCKDSTQPSD
ncbi:uncharacterized protein M437DRAFT_43341 [Aureobasidium melanogenum CBS 110374]|uniref:F-box domain-containing protein n=1 Tax=Aureobasidium melanogenum (strain CBS 110374) TaxID=1043003 RepID=A0A074WQE4_AURM1|nr:uncharacterized protein M437DRAFT_43341 [Aureobasidium melanogenum CBS 110374]KEQ64616.1 hypothetical protein M437DRAFT_43341 [Aureobasidium melanogenum CBS 110374]